MGRMLDMYPTSATCMAKVNRQHKKMGGGELWQVIICGGLIMKKLCNGNKKRGQNIKMT